jgi:hypothetical protein
MAMMYSSIEVKPEARRASFPPEKPRPNGGWPF